MLTDALADGNGEACVGSMASFAFVFVCCGVFYLFPYFAKLSVICFEGFPGVLSSFFMVWGFGDFVDFRVILVVCCLGFPGVLNMCGALDKVF